MPLTTYPVGSQILKVPVTIVIPAVNTPFNPDAINPAITWTWNGMKALEAYGLYSANFDKAQPPYPNVGGSYVNSGTYYLSGSLVLSGAGGIAFASPSARSYTRGPKGIFAVTISATQWLMPTGGAYEQGTDVVTGSPIIWVMNVPPNSTITGVSLLVDPPAGHGGVLPATPPSMRTLICNASTGVYGLVAGSNVSDPTLIADYEAVHSFATGVLAGSVGSDDFVVVEVRGEYGGSAVPGLSVSPPSITYTRTKLGEE